MGYERYIQNTDPRGDYDVHDDLAQSRDRGTRASDWDRGGRDSSAARYESETYWGRDRTQGGRGGYGQQPRQQRYGTDPSYRGSYASDGRRFVENDRDVDDGSRFGGYGERPDRFARQQPRGNRYGLQPQRTDRDDAYDYDERGFLSRAGDEVRSWFGDDEAERRRMLDERYDERLERDDHHRSDADYDSWRREQIKALDRDYAEYRRENRSKFHSEFSGWREERQNQRSSLSSVQEHMEVVGSDGAHVGTVDKVRGDRIILTKNDDNAGGHHHSIPSRWIQSVDDKVTIRKTADDAMNHWKDEERNQALFEDANRGAGETRTSRRYSTSY
ncbi:MAG: hypothetical protein B7Y45_11095 [Sphingomonas sp. 28-66-16]|nr:MAG: hypothetical protein B7Y45_11095 [Sphingomonas sp. 28-66-16]